MKEILIEQNRHWDNYEYKSIKREKLDKLISYLPLKQIITITGIRRCGKSTLAKQAINYLIKNGVNAKNILFVNLENPYFLEFRDSPTFLDVIFKEYLKLINPQGKIYCFFDEIQYIKNWQVYIKSKYENSDIKFIITGSNSSMLSNELNTMLSGRSLNIHLSGFNFREFLRYKRIDFSNELAIIKNSIQISRAKDEYLKWGGFYEVFDTQDETIKKDILISYAKNIIYQDIIPRYKIRNAYLVERFFYYLLLNTTGILNYSNLAKTFDITDKTVKEYINYFEDAFIFKRIDKHHSKQKVSIKSAKKIYVQDNGFLQIAQNNSKNSGKLLENAVFNELYNRFEDLKYLKDRYEIDFFANNNLYQVAYDISNEKTLKRELNAFKHYCKKDNNCILVTYNENRLIEQKINVISFDRFCLED
jgi:predicted AAA+ superfamily ATPase